jgi:hypothetical protein
VLRQIFTTVRVVVPSLDALIGTVVADFAGSFTQACAEAVRARNASTVPTSHRITAAG